MRALASMFACLCALTSGFGVSTSQTLTLTGLAAGDTRHVSDMVQFMYEGDSLYMSSGMSTVVKLSPDAGEYWFILCPEESPPFYPVPFDSPFRGQPRYVIPETVPSSPSLDSNRQPIAYSTVSEKAMVKTYDCVDDRVLDLTDGVFTIRGPSALSVDPRASDVADDEGHDIGCSRPAKNL